MEIKEFIEKHKIEALQIDLSKELPLVFNILQSQKNKLAGADFDSEIEEVKSFCLKGIEETKRRISNDLISESYLGKLIGGKALFLFDIKTYFEYLELYRLCDNKKPQQPATAKIDKVKNLHPKHDPNLWNIECYNLFKYLFDEYYKSTKRQLTNIWFYLKEYDSKKYILSATKELYSDFITHNYEITITNFDKATQKWEDKERNKIDEHRQDYEDSLK